MVMINENIIFNWRNNGRRQNNGKPATKEDLACIQSVKIKPTEFGTEREIKLCDKKSNLELLGKHLGMFKDKLELEADMELNINIDYGDENEQEKT